jgi:DNA topoisomerase-3
MTGDWETKLDLIYKKNLGQHGYNDFVSEIKDFTISQVNTYKNTDIETSREATPKMIAFAKKLAKEYKVKNFDPKETDSEVIKQFIDSQLNKDIPCPCGKGQIVVSPKAFTCKSCNRTIWKEVAGKKLTLDNALDLLKGKTIKLKGFKSKAGKKFDAGLKLVDGKTTFVFN